MDNKEKITTKHNFGLTIKKALLKATIIRRKIILPASESSLLIQELNMRLFKKSHQDKKPLSSQQLFL